MHIKNKEPYYPEVMGHMFDVLENRMMPAIEVEETRIVGLANELVGSYVARKSHLHELFKHDPANAGKSHYSPLQLLARHRKGSLQLYWQEMHFVPVPGTEERRRKFKTIYKSPTGTYSIDALKKVAGYATELVPEYEMRSRELRERWKQLMQLKKDIRNAIKRLPVGVEQVLASLKEDSLDKLIPRSQGDFDSHNDHASV